jgi:hypothetical protein
MGTIMILYVVFLTGFQEFFVQSFIYKSSDFFHWIFSKIIIILCEVQALKGECYNTENIHLNFITRRQLARCQARPP